MLTVISYFYEAFRDNTVVALILKGMRAGVAAVIADVVVTMARGSSAGAPSPAFAADGWRFCCLLFLCG